MRRIEILVLVPVCSTVLLFLDLLLQATMEKHGGFGRGEVPWNQPRNKESAEELERSRVAFNLRRMRTSYTLGDLLEESSRGVSTHLSLYHHYDPFTIKKKMKPSDLGNLCRLLVPSDLVEKYILPFLNTDQIKQVNQETNLGLKVSVWDMNTQSMHQLVFKRWSTSRSYIFNDGWTKDFVRRRNLVEGDEIGLYWDTYHSRFNFNVLSRAAAAAS